MTGELVFYTNPMSRGRVVRWMLEEVARPYRTELLDYDAMKAPAYLAINPMGKVPALVHGTTAVTEVAAICAYLADAFPQAGLAPAPTDPLRGPYLKWLFYAAGPLEAAIIDRALGVEIPDDKRRMVGYGRFADVVETLDAALSNTSHLVGERFTAADLYLGAQLGWTMQFGMMEKRPSFERYVASLFARPAAIRAREIDDALIPPRPQG